MTEGDVDLRFKALFQSDMEWWIDELHGTAGWPRSRLVALLDEMREADVAQVGDLAPERISIYWKLIAERPPDRIVECPGCGKVAVREPDDYLCHACRRAFDARHTGG
jgi:hypothetical protein